MVTHFDMLGIMKECIFTSAIIAYRLHDSYKIVVLYSALDFFTRQWSSKPLWHFTTGVIVLYFTPAIRPPLSIPKV